MFEYIKELFTKPEIKLSTIDKLAMAGILIAGLIIIAIILCFICYLYHIIKEKIKLKKLKKLASEQQTIIIQKHNAGREYYDRNRRKD